MPSQPAMIENEPDDFYNEPDEEINTTEYTTDNSTTDNNNDSDTEDQIFEDIIGNQNIKIYPNPTSGRLVVDIPNYSHNAKDYIDIYDMNGSLKKRISPLSASNTIYIHEYTPATYIMLIHISGETVEWKIIKQ